MTDMHGHAAATSLVTAGTVLLGTVLLGTVLIGTVLLAAGCASSGTPARTTELRVMVGKYMAIAQPANRELDHEFDGLDDHAKDGDLAAARADLRAAAATEPVEDAVRGIRGQLGLPPPDTS